jgi:SAM-dependent methyltransferase
MSTDLDRLRREYADRDRRLSGSDIYSLTNPGCLFLVQQRQRAVLRLLRREGRTDLAAHRILEVGCGTGSVLNEFICFGARPENLHGVDLIADRVAEAKRLRPNLNLICADGQSLPYGASTFDIILQFTAFSSVLDTGIKAVMARDMLRVLRPNGLIIWYDFWINPFNRHTSGIRRPEIIMLFPDCHYYFQRTTLAPPISRWLAPKSWLMCLMLEYLRVFNTHYLAGIRKGSGVRDSG